MIKIIWKVFYLFFIYFIELCSKKLGNCYKWISDELKEDIQNSNTELSKNKRLKL